MHIVAVQTEDEQLVPRPGPPPPSPPASVEREILNETDQDASLVGVRLVTQDKLLPELPIQQLSEHESAQGKDPRPLAFQPRKMFSLRSNQAHSPPASKPVREHPARRNTTGSSPNKTTAALQPGSSSSSRGQLPSFGAALDDSSMDKDANELANEIQQAAEQIRRERLSKRAKQQAQQAEHDAVEAALFRQDTRRSAGSAKDDVVLVGNLIGEGHVNYILMYNMLTGIRIGVRIYPLYSLLLS
jgi:1-phosphatidylinositol-4-phosphate 5-kinase